MKILHRSLFVQFAHSYSLRCTFIPILPQRRPMFARLESLIYSINFINSVFQSVHAAIDAIPFIFACILMTPSRRRLSSGVPV